MKLSRQFALYYWADLLVLWVRIDIRKKLTYFQDREIYKFCIVRSCIFVYFLIQLWQSWYFTLSRYKERIAVVLAVLEI